MAVVTAPYYDDTRLTGAGSIRVPSEVGTATMMVKQYNTINCSSIGGSTTTNTITLQPYKGKVADVAGSGVASGAEASYLVFTGAGSGATTVSLPAADPGHRVVVRNSSGQNVVFKVASQSGVTIATGSAQDLVCNTTDIVAAAPATA